MDGNFLVLTCTRFFPPPPSNLSFGAVDVDLLLVNPIYLYSNKLLFLSVGSPRPCCPDRPPLVYNWFSPFFPPTMSTPPPPHSPVPAAEFNLSSDGLDSWPPKTEFFRAPEWRLEVEPRGAVELVTIRFFQFFPSPSGLNLFAAAYRIGKRQPGRDRRRTQRDLASLLLPYLCLWFFLAYCFLSKDMS